MVALAKYIALAITGVLTGALSSHVWRSTHGSVKRRLAVRYLFDVILLAPGPGLVAFLGARGGFNASIMLLAFLFPHAVARFLVGRKDAQRRVLRESMLPFEHWYEMRTSHPAAAEEFLRAYVFRCQAEGRDMSAALSQASSFLAARHVGDPGLPAALNALRSQTANVEHARVQREIRSRAV